MSSFLQYLILWPLLGSIPAIAWFRRWDLWFSQGSGPSRKALSIAPLLLRLFFLFSYFLPLSLFLYRLYVCNMSRRLPFQRGARRFSFFFASVIPVACFSVASLVCFVRRLATLSSAPLSPLLWARLRAPRLSLSLSSASSCLSLLALFETWSCTGGPELLFIAPPF